MALKRCNLKIRTRSPLWTRLRGRLDRDAVIWLLGCLAAISLALLALALAPAD